MKDKIIFTCYQCPYWEDLRYYWCHLMYKDITGIAEEIPKDCSLEDTEVTRKIRVKGKKIKNKV